VRDRYVVLVTTAPSLDRATLELASRLASRANAVLLFFHVVPFRRGDGEAMLHAAADVLGRRDERWLRGLAPTEPGTRFLHRLEMGEPEEVVTSFCDEHGVELLVLEEPPRSRVAATLWRGPAERLIRRVRCPVVIGGPRFLRQPLGERRDRSTPRRHPLETADLLNALVDARVQSLVRWMDQSAATAARVAASDAVGAVVQLAAGGRSGALAYRLERGLRVELTEHQLAQRAVGWRLVSRDRQWTNLDLSLAPSPALEEHYARLYATGRSTSLPLALTDGPQLVVLSGARVSAGRDGEAVLQLVFDASEDFLRILGQPGAEPSLETYAFDRTGLMLSNSRFPHHLRAAGLLPEDDVQTTLRLRVAEPSDGPSESWPLTRMAQAAIRRQDGFDLRGYPDYRGTEVVGAWRWIDSYGFGVTAEVDA
jgi:nucleotide-binding universal stress UspA family protein